jgi:hypothetical protein
MIEAGGGRESKAYRESPESKNFGRARLRQKGRENKQQNCRLHEE